MHFDFSDQTALITGAAGNLGSAVARGLLSGGAKLVLAAHSTDKLVHEYPALANDDDHMLEGGVDLTQEDEVLALFERIDNRYGGIDILVNTVGGFRGGEPIAKSTLEDWNFMFRINLETALLTSRAAAPRMTARSYGRIVNVASKAALEGAPDFAAYSTAKGAVLHLTQALAGELKSHNITANCVLPGTIDTPANRKAMPGADYKTWVTPEDVACAILFLCSREARGVTAAALPITGRA